MKPFNQAKPETVTLFKVLSNEKRVCILSYLHAAVYATNKVINKYTGVAQPQVSHALKLLMSVGLVHKEKLGKQMIYSINQHEWKKVKHLFMP